MQILALINKYNFEFTYNNILHIQTDKFTVFLSIFINRLYIKWSYKEKKINQQIMR
jgi:hypothetical protein